MALSKKKTSLLHVAKAHLELDDDDYRAILWHFAGVTSARDLDAAGFAAVMDAFARLGFQSEARGTDFGQRRNMASDRQVAMIRTLWRDFTAGEGTDATLGRWMEGKFKISSLRFLTAAMAPKVIGALQIMTGRRRPQRNR